MTPDAWIVVSQIALKAGSALAFRWIELWEKAKAGTLTRSDWEPYLKEISYVDKVPNTFLNELPNP